MIHALSRKAAFAVPLAALTLAVSSAFAAPVPGPSGSAFYNAPATIPAGEHGDLIQYLPTTLNLGADTPQHNAWTVMYQSRDVNNKATVSTGTVIVPKNAAPVGVIMYAMGTHGLGNDCAPSKQMVSGNDYEAANVAAALKAGYAVLVSDYVGYTNGATPRYMAGASQGRNTLDMFRAATQIPSVGIDAASKVAIWGYSQGGQTAAFAAELAPTYTPTLNVVGVAHGGTPSDFFAVSRYLNKANGMAFFLKAMSGLATEYGPVRMPVTLALNPAGQQMLKEIRTECVFKALFKYQNKDVAEYMNNGLTLDDLIGGGLNGVPQVLEEQAVGKTKVNVPMYQFHGKADEFIPLDQAFKVKQAYCAKGTTVSFDAYPSEHIATLFQAGPAVLSWINDRFAGKQAPNSCSNNTAPVSTAFSNTGNLTVRMDKWPLAAKVDLKTLKQTVVLPQGTTFSADADVTAQQLVNGSLYVPKFSQSLKLLGIGAQIALVIEPTGPITGKVSLDDQGILRIKDGMAQTNITVASVWGIPFGQCKTEKPVDFPLNFEGPISSLGNGQITFTGTTSFPMIKGCIISAIVSAFMTGSGQAYTFNLQLPPATPN
ncbi:MAG: lipase family protein [Aquabacterium sp.]